MLEEGSLTETETYRRAQILSYRQKLRGYEVLNDNISPIIRENHNGNSSCDNKGVE